VRLLINDIFSALFYGVVDSDVPVLEQLKDCIAEMVPIFEHTNIVYGFYMAHKNTENPIFSCAI
jgi:hypothetical protein